jgi:hypothetical protein
MVTDTEPERLGNNLQRLAADSAEPDIRTPSTKINSADGDVY